jgi:hypothetical protein
VMHGDFIGGVDHQEPAPEGRMPEGRERHYASGGIDYRCS